jgi:hypothetical protein
MDGAKARARSRSSVVTREIRGDGDEGHQAIVEAAGKGSAIKGYGCDRIVGGDVLEVRDSLYGDDVISASEKTKGVR